MPDLESLLGGNSGLTPAIVAVVALAGLVVGIAPSSFPLLSVATGLAAGRGAGEPDRSKTRGLWLAAGFALGIATVDAVLGALFGFAGFAVMRVLASVLWVAYAVLAVVLLITGLALLRVIRVRIPVRAATAKPAQTFAASYLLGIPFGLSTCPACTPLVLPVVAAAAATGDPVLGAVLMFTFGLARGVPIVVAGTAAGILAYPGRARRWVRVMETTGGALILMAALYYLYQAGAYLGWVSPL